MIGVLQKIKKIKKMYPINILILLISIYFNIIEKLHQEVEEEVEAILNKISKKIKLVIMNYQYKSTILIKLLN